MGSVMAAGANERVSGGRLGQVPVRDRVRAGVVAVMLGSLFLIAGLLPWIAGGSAVWLLVVATVMGLVGLYGLLAGVALLRSVAATRDPAACDDPSPVACAGCAGGCSLARLRP